MQSNPVRMRAKISWVGELRSRGPRSRFSSAASRYAGKSGFVLLARGGNIIKYGADDAHPVVDVDEIHHRHNELGFAQVGAMARRAGQAGHNRANEKVR